MKIEYKPYGFSAGSTDIASEEALIGSSVTGLGLNTVTVRLAVDFTLKKANTSWSKYVSV